MNPIWLVIFAYFAIVFLYAYNKEANEKIIKQREAMHVNIIEHRYGVETLRSQYQVSRYQLSQISPDYVETFLQDQKRTALHEFAEKAVKQFALWEEEKDPFQTRDVKKFSITMSVVNLNKEL